MGVPGQHSAGHPGRSGDSGGDAQRKVDWEDMDKGAGYAAVFSFDNLEDLTTGIDQVLAAQGPVFIHLAITPEVENTPVAFRPRARRSVQTAFRELPVALGTD